MRLNVLVKIRGLGATEFKKYYTDLFIFVLSFGVFIVQKID